MKRMLGSLAVLFLMLFLACTIVAQNLPTQTVPFGTNCAVLYGYDHYDAITLCQVPPSLDECAMVSTTASRIAYVRRVGLPECALLLKDKWLQTPVSERPATRPEETK
jgi:hypothetical protein